MNESPSPISMALLYCACSIDYSLCEVASNSPRRKEEGNRRYASGLFSRDQCTH